MLRVRILLEVMNALAMRGTKVMDLYVQVCKCSIEKYTTFSLYWPYFLAVDFAHLVFSALLVSAYGQYISLYFIFFLFKTVSDACGLGTHDCHQHASCENTDDGYECTCNVGYDGDGRTCTGR